MELTHAQAREMIQFDADSALSKDSRRILKSHLASCEACRLYADSIHAMEVHLRRAMIRRWDLRPAPLALDTIKSNSFSKSIQPAKLATRLVMITTVALMVVITAFGITNPAKENDNNQAPMVVPLIPTPSMQITHTLTQTCEQVRYQVQPNDTLESIAFQYSITSKDLMTANNINSETVISGMAIIIPVCNSTPTGTVHPPTFTTTITPLIEVLSETPGG